MSAIILNQNEKPQIIMNTLWDCQTNKFKTESEAPHPKRFACGQILASLGVGHL